MRLSVESCVRVASLLGLALLGGAAQAAPACPFKTEDLAKVFGVGFAAGVEEPGIGGSACKYRSKGGSAKAGTDLSVWVLTLPPGPNQDMMRTMTAGGPKAKFEPVAGDPDGAARVRGADDSLVDLSYKRNGHVVFLRALGLSHEPDAQARAAREAQLVARLLKLPRLP